MSKIFCNFAEDFDKQHKNIQNMQVKNSDLIGGISGNLDNTKYVRAIPGKPDWSAVCQKPNYSKKELAEMAQRPAVLKFTAITKQASAILKDEAQKAEWKKRYIEAKREASRHQKYTDTQGKLVVPARLYDFIRHELSKQS